MNISRIGLGCMSLKSERANDAVALLLRAFDDGINYFDTADIYENGLNEMLVGKAFHSIREKVIIATKVGNVLKEDGSGLDWNPRKGHILKSAEESLRRLNTSYIDLYQLHGGTIEDPIDETIEAFELLKQQGKIRYYGISSIRPNVIREYVKRSGIVSVMMQYSIADRRPEEEMLDLLFHNQIGVLARGSLAQGMLLTKPAKDYLGHSAAELKLAAEYIRALSEKRYSPSQVAIGYVLKHPAVIASVIGCSNMPQLNEAVKAGESIQLKESEWEQFGGLLKPRRYDLHR